MNLSIQQPLLHSGEQVRLRRAISERVQFLSRDESGARQVLYRALYRSIKEKYQVSSYKELKQNQLQDALRFVAHWGGELHEKRS